jgi:hypothetical protein
MTRDRRTIWAPLAALAVIACAPSVATAKSSPLLSGYGGPGQGEQAILGGGLVNTPKGGGGGSGSSGAGSSELTLPSSSAGSTSKAGTGSSAAGHRAARRHHPSSTSSTVPSQGNAATALPSAQVSDRGVSGGTLGVSSGEVLYLLLALAALALTGALTRQLARRAR